MIDSDIQPTELYNCGSCDELLPINSKFCKTCGSSQLISSTAGSDKRQTLIQIGFFFALELIYCLSAKLITESSIAVSFAYDALFAITALAFFVNSWKQNKQVLMWKHFSFKLLIVLALGTIVCSITVQYLVRLLNRFVLEEEYSYYFTYMFHPQGKLLMILSIAVFPAIFEELAYRGFLMQKLLDVVNKTEATYISSILFFLIHFSMISFFWMLPLAFVLAQVRLRTNTIWYGVVIHFLFNLGACLYELQEFEALF